MDDAQELHRQIKTLERRQNYLGQRIAQQGRGNKHKIAGEEAYDRSEFKALATAIELMGQHLSTLPMKSKKGPK